jgi:hypothetical protein
MRACIVGMKKISAEMAIYISGMEKESAEGNDLLSNRILIKLVSIITQELFCNQVHL